MHLFGYYARFSLQYRIQYVLFLKEPGTFYVRRVIKFRIVGREDITYRNTIRNTETRGTNLLEYNIGGCYQRYISLKKVRMGTSYRCTVLILL